MVKRLLDLTICVLALLFLLPLMAVIALAIVLDSPGSSFYVHTRVGKNGRPFRMVKFRTMVSNHDSREEQQYMASYVSGKVAPNVTPEGRTTFKSAKAAHVTRIGRFLRKSSLDELPQIWNILIGDMSLIGPRPNLPVEVDQYTPMQAQRLAIRPGLTGLAQVRGRSNITFQEIVEHDLEYIHNQSLKLDVQILWWTVFKVLDFSEAG